ncbi:golgin subfamily A member 4 isoform X2 [Halyomorpha halys]|uniref:golgin subfamily A member 4 isoform X2 n=1 Tax=Halyomorpha halys TaxID=286706 RepID=UPI0034D30172
MEFCDTMESEGAEGPRMEHRFSTEDKISSNLMNFFTEDVSLKQAFKLALLDNAFSKWRKSVLQWGQKDRIEILDKKREKRKQWVRVLEVPQAYIRWIKCTKDTMMTSIKNSAVLLASGYFIFVYDINMDNYILYSPDDVDGIGCIRGSQEEDFFAFSEKKNEPSIFIVTYPDLQIAFILRDQYHGKVIDIQFGSNGLLLSLKCDFAEHRVVVWYWRCTYVLCSYVLDKPQIHPEYFSASLEGTYYALLQEHYGKTLIQFWYLTILCDESLLVKKYTGDITLENYIFHDMQFDSNGVLHLLDEKGNLYTYDKKSKKANILIPWKPTSPPVDDIIEQQKIIENFLPERRRVAYEESVEYEKEDYKPKPEGEPKVFKYKRYQYEDVSSDIYEPEPIKKQRKKNCAKTDSENTCYFVWFKDGIVVSGPNGKLKYYTKDTQNGKWFKAWGMIPCGPLRRMVTNQKKDRLFGWSESLGLKEIIPMETSCRILQFFGGSIIRIALLRPSDNFLVTLNTTKTICIWRKKTGQLMNSIRLSCDMKDMAVHQSSSLIALFPYNEGCIYGIDLTHPRVPAIWPVLKVFREQSFAWIKFLDDDWLIACTEFQVEVALIKASIYHGFEVIATYKFYYEIINMIGVLAHDCIYYGVALFEKVQPGSQTVPKGYVAGKMFEVLKFPALMHERAFTSENFYKNIYTGPGIGHILAMPADIKFELHSYYIDVKEGGNWRLLRRITVDHQIGAFEIDIVGQHYITYGFDGHIFFHDSSDLLNDDNKPLATLRNHHRWDEGVQQAVVDYQGKYILSLGQEGHITCSRIKYKFWCRHPLHIPKKNDQTVRNPLAKVVFKHVSEYEGEFWEDVVTRKKFENDRLLTECRVMRIEKIFKDLKKLWKEYYDQNQMESEGNRLSEEEFELDKDRLPIMETVINKETTRKLKELTENLQFYKEWIGYWKELCWGKMYIKLYRVKPFQARFFLENFSQSLKPYKYVCYHRLVDTLSHMNAAIFPLYDPKMLPWNKLDENKEFPELKMQKDPYEEVVEDKEETEEHEKQSLPTEDLKKDEKVEEEEEEVYEEEIEVECEEEEVAQAESSDDPCSGIHTNLGTKEEIEQRKFIEDELKKDEEELKAAPKGQMTIDEILALARKLEQAQNPNDSETALVNEPFITTEELKELATWKEEELKKYWEGTLSEKEKEDLLIQTLDKLLRNDKKKFRQLKAMYGIVEDGEESSIVDEELVIEEEKEDVIEEEQKAIEEEAEAEAAAGEEHVNLQELEGNLFLKSLEEAPISESSFSWSDIAFDEEFAEEDPTKKEESEKAVIEEHDHIDAAPVPQRPAAAPVEETAQEEENLEILPQDPFDEPYYMTGSQTPKFIKVDFARYNEFTCNGIFMADTHVSTLKGIIENLEGVYNEIFEDQFVKKAEDLLLIKKKQNEIHKNIDDLTNICLVEAPSPPAIEHSWSLGEVPEWIFEYEPSEEEFSKLINQILIKNSDERPLTEREQLRKELKELGTHKPDELESKDCKPSEQTGTNENEIDEDIFKKQTLHEMMDGVIEMSWQEIVKKGVELPSFVNEKDPESYTERERIAMNKYVAAVKKIDEKRKYHANLACQDIEKLKAEIEKVACNYDIGLLETAKKRILIESCMQSELLKVARLKLRRLTADKGVEHINFLKSLKNEYLDKGVEITIFIKYLQKKMALILKEIEKYDLMPNKIEKEFLKKINPLSLPKKIVETFKVLIKNKPAITDEFEKKACSNELHAMAAYLDQDYKPIYVSEASEKYFKELNELDSLKNCPPNIDSVIWSLVIHSRNAMLSANMKFQLVLPDGLVETRQTGDIEDFADCVYISKRYIDKLNEDIMELEKQNHGKLKDLDGQMNSVFDTELLHKELRLRIKIEENNLKDIRFMRANKYVKDYLAELKMNDQEPYDTKDYDLMRGEKLRKIVRKYFKKYYDALKSIKKAKEGQKILMQENVDLKNKINKMTIMNQAAGEQLKPAKKDLQDPRQSIGQAIVLKAELTRQVDENHQQIDNLWQEFEKLRNRTVPILP